jgi:hypothetical protein
MLLGSRSLSTLLLALALAACGEGNATRDAQTDVPDTSVPLDAVGPDTGLDSAVEPDVTPVPDSGSSPDSGDSPDSGEPADSSLPPDTGVDASLPPDATVDASLPPDAAVDASVPPDAAPDAAVAPDAGDAAPPIALGPVQCRANADCRGPAASCNRQAPGGICLGCGGDSDCGALSCYVGACVRDCTRDSDCNLGMRCGSAGRCITRPCPCPAPYVCGGSGTCVRPSCDGSTPCPSPLVCSSGICMEP